MNAPAPAALAEFWGKALGRPVSDPRAVKNRLRPVLLTGHHDEETGRLASLGAKLVNEIRLPAIRHSTFADPRGQSE